MNTEENGNGNNIHPAGIFPATVIDHGVDGQPGKSTAVTVSFQTERGFITGWFYLTDRAAEYTAEKLLNMGFSGTSFAELNTEPPCLAGNKCVITVNHDEYEGKKRAKVDFVNPENWEGGAVKKNAAAAQNAAQFDAVLYKKQGATSVKASIDAAIDAFPL